MTAWRRLGDEQPAEGQRVIVWTGHSMEIGTRRGEWLSGWMVASPIEPVAHPDWLWTEAPAEPGRERVRGTCDNCRAFGSYCSSTVPDRTCGRWEPRR